MRTITIKGTGFVKEKVDYVEIYINLSTLDYEYSEAYKILTEKNKTLNTIIKKLGFKSEDLKTLSFDVRKEISNYKNSNGKYIDEFEGYRITHKLKLSFDFDIKFLSKVISTISSSNINPNLNIKFTLKDPSKIERTLLESATKNAMEKAQILCSASNTKLGDLQVINYNWDEISIYSSTRYETPLERVMLEKPSINFQPDDIDAEDTVTFVWEILNI